MIYFTKRGLLIAEGGNGKLFYFDPSSSLRDIAAFIADEPELSSLLGEPESSFTDNRDSEYIDFRESSVADSRLRSQSVLETDRRFRNIFSQERNREF
ncbi:MAG: hypothetical protein MJ234_01695 [bacterium]|nr:hypothetical protein [bacterium]